MPAPVLATPKIDAFWRIDLREIEDEEGVTWLDIGPRLRPSTEEELIERRAMQENRFMV